MHLTQVSSTKRFPVVIEPLTKEEFGTITKRRYSFNWKTEKEQLVYKLRIAGQDDILGLMSLEFHDAEYRVHVRLVAVSKENKGKGKLFERIAGSLFAYAAMLALEKYGELAAISLRPKTELGQHYMDEYGFKQSGISLSMEGRALYNLFNKYE